ncbi:MAG: hypothetical protein ACP5I1_04665 [Candidatus Hinthialibacter sp.]
MTDRFRHDCAGFLCGERNAANGAPSYLYDKQEHPCRKGRGGGYSCIPAY